MTPRRRGFTLIELLLAMSMVAMLTLAVYTGLSVAVRARAVAVVQTDALRQAKAALDLVEQELRSVPPPGGILAGAFTGSPAGTGDAAAAYLDFYSLGGDPVAGPAASAAAPVDGIRHVQLMLSSDGTAPLLTRTLTRNLIDPSNATPETDTLARNVHSFSAMYYDGQAWTESWDSTSMSNSLPLAVEVTVAIRTPTATDPAKVYRMSRVVPMSCGLTPDQSAAVLTAAQADTAPSPPGVDTGGGQ